jgi:hypothetical protein
MSQDAASVREDLAFMRRIVDGGGDGKGQAALGWSYFWCGLLYGFQCVVQWADGEGLIALSDRAMGLFVTGVTAVFVVATILIGRRYGRAAAGGAANRGVGIAFGVIGISNVVLVTIFGLVTWRLAEEDIFLIYPIVVFAMQGAAWVIAGLLRRRGWMNLVGAGWYVSALVMALTLGTPLFVLTVGLALVFLMVLPGWVLIRLARRAG